MRSVNTNYIILSIRYYFSKQLTCFPWTQKYFKLIKVNIQNFSEHFYKLLKYNKHRTRSEVGILLEIILNAFKCLTVSSSAKIFTLAIAPLLFIYSFYILFIHAMLPGLYILLFPQAEEVHSLF